MTPTAGPGATVAEAAERVRAECLDAAISAYEDAGLRGLCAEGRWEAAIGAVRRLDLAPALLDSCGGDPHASR